ncbi:MAG: HesB/IscA family protein [Bacteroidota bacterium]
MNSEITVTEKAISEINRIKADNNIPSEYGLRIGVKAGGCSGLSYSLGFDSAPTENDVICEFEGLKVYVDPKSSFYLLGTELDYTSGLNGKGFVFSNPKAVKTCGCGHSFSA